MCPTTSAILGNMLIKIKGGESECAVVEGGGQLSSFKLLGGSLDGRAYNGGVLQYELSALYLGATSSGSLLEFAYIVSSWIASILAVLGGDRLLLAGHVRIASIRAGHIASHVSAILSSHFVGVLETDLGGFISVAARSRLGRNYCKHGEEDSNNGKHFRN